MKPWQFKILKRVWGDWGPSDILLVGVYAGTKMARTLPFRKFLVCSIVGLFAKEFVEKVDD